MDYDQIALRCLDAVNVALKKALDFEVNSDEAQASLMLAQAIEQAWSIKDIQALVRLGVIQEVDLLGVSPS